MSEVNNMEKPQNNTNLARLVADLEENTVLELVHERIEAGEDPLQIIYECNEGMREVGMRYEQGEYFVAGLIMSGEIFRQVVEMVQPFIEQQANRTSSGHVLVGTVSGDIHDLGKNMFGMLLSCHGFDVTDLGVDVPPEVFASKAAEIQPDIVGLSGLVTASFSMMKETVTALRQKSIQHGLTFPIIIGGGMIDEQICQFVGADYWVPDAMAGVRLTQELIKD
jgi:methylmalonyl-CoA mutase cobalamin-binding domain/chain